MELKARTGNGWSVCLFLWHCSVLMFAVPDSTKLTCLRVREETKWLDFKGHKAHIQNELTNCFWNLLHCTQFKFRHNQVLNHYNDEEKNVWFQSQVFQSLIYGFWKNPLQKDEPLTSWTIFSHFGVPIVPKWGKKCSTGQRFIFLKCLLTKSML